MGLAGAHMCHLSGRSGGAAVMGRRHRTHGVAVPVIGGPGPDPFLSEMLSCYCYSSELSYRRRDANPDQFLPHKWFYLPIALFAPMLSSTLLSPEHLFSHSVPV